MQGISNLEEISLRWNPIQTIAGFAFAGQSYLLTSYICTFIGIGRSFLSVDLYLIAIDLPIPTISIIYSNSNCSDIQIKIQVHLLQLLLHFAGMRNVSQIYLGYNKWVSLLDTFKTHTHTQQTSQFEILYLKVKLLIVTLLKI